MALKLGELVAFLKADKSEFDRDLVASELEFRATGDRMARDADQTGKEIGEHLGAGGGKGVDKFTRDASGRLRDARGRFVREGDEIGRALGDGIGRNTGWLGRVQGVVRQLGGAFSSAQDWVKSTTDRVSDFAGRVAGVTGTIWGIVQVLGVLAAVAAAAVPAVGLLGGALGAIPALTVGLGAGVGVLALGFMGLQDQFKKTASAGGAVVDKAYQIAVAERRVRDANLEVLAAQEALTRARETAAKRIDDLNRSIANAHLDERAAVLAVADAEEKLKQAQRTGTRADIDRAQLAYDQAEQSLDDIRARLKDMGEEQAKNAQQGVEGSDEVKAAYDRQRKAVEGVEDAEHALAEARKPQGGGGGAAEQIAKIAPAAAAAVAVIKQLKPAFDDLRLDVQQRLFAGVASEIRDLAVAWLPTLHDKLGGLAGTVNGLFHEFAGNARRPEFITNIGKGLDSVDRLVNRIGRSVAGPFVDAWGRLTAAAGPFLDALGDEVGGLVDDFSRWIKSADESGKLESFMQRAADFLHDVFHIGRDVGGIIGDIMHALFSDPKNAKGGSTWENLQKNLDDLKAWFDDPTNQKKIQDWFQQLQAAGKIFLTVAGWIGTLIVAGQDLVHGVSDWTVRAAKAIDTFGHDVSKRFDQLVGWVSGLPGRISTATSGMFDGVKNAFRGALNYVIGGWNRLHFTIGGASFMGVNVPSFTLNTPDIPFLKDGGVVRATPGGRLVGVGEGGEDEAVLPLSRLAALLHAIGGGTRRVVFDTGGDAVLDALFRAIRYKVLGDYDGDVNAAFAKG